MIEQAQILVNNQLYNGCKSVNVLHSMENISGGFNMELAAPLSDKGQPIWPIKRGDACQVLLSSDVVITGWVIKRQRSLAKEAITYTISGYDKAGDMVKGSAIHKPDEWRGLKIEAIVAILAKPFGITVIAEVDTGKPVSLFKLNQGESAFDALDRLCQMRSCLVINDHKGGLVITRAGNKKSEACLIEGQNFKLLEDEDDEDERHSEYVVKGQGTGAEGYSPKATANVKGNSVDEGITRYKPLLITSEGGSDGISASGRAAWEAVVRAARGYRLSGQVATWRQSQGGPLWEVNTLVRVISPSLELDDYLLLSEASFSQGRPGGSVTDLSLTRPDAFKQLVKVEKASGGSVAGAEVVTSSEQLKWGRQ